MIISIASSKGGCSKSTTTMHLATTLGQKHKVLVVDADNQRTIYEVRQFEQRQAEVAAPFEVEAIAPQFVFDFLKIKRAAYDYIFIDIPRITLDNDSNTLSLLTLCDFVLLPVIASNVDILSTIKFIEALEKIKAYKENNDIDFDFQGFIAKKNRRKENEQIAGYMEENGLQMFESFLPDIKLLSYSNTFDSLLDNNQGKQRFSPFYKEFLAKIS